TFVARIELDGSRGSVNGRTGFLLAQARDCKKVPGLREGLLEVGGADQVSLHQCRIAWVQVRLTGPMIEHNRQIEPRTSVPSTEVRGVLKVFLRFLKILFGQVDVAEPAVSG